MAARQEPFIIIGMKLIPVVLLLAICLPWCEARCDLLVQAGQPHAIGDPQWRAEAGLSWFPDGNLGAIRRGGRTLLYGANGPKPVRLTLNKDNRLIKVEPVDIDGVPQRYQYLAGGPVYRDPKSGRLLLFYHAEIHRGSLKNFYSVLGLAIQTDREGLRFRDIGPIFSPNLPEDHSPVAFEACGAPVVMNQGYLYVYARDAAPQGRVNQLIVLRCPVNELVAAAIKGKAVEWRKFYQGRFSEPGLGGRSSPLEKGNPAVRWMDVTFNKALNLFVMIVAAPTHRGTALFAAWSPDGIHWGKRVGLFEHRGGECFYPSIISSPLRETGNEFLLAYTFSRKGGWDRWNDAVWLTRTVKIVPGNSAR